MIKKTNLKKKKIPIIYSQSNEPFIVPLFLVTNRINSLIIEALNKNSLLKNKLAVAPTKEDVANNLSLLIDAGVPIKQLIRRLHSDQIMDNFSILTKHKGKISISTIISKIYPIAFSDFEILINHGIGINRAIDGLDRNELIANLDKIISMGADINKIADSLVCWPWFDDMLEWLPKLPKDKLDGNNLIITLVEWNQGVNLARFMELGIKLDFNKIIKILKPLSILHNLDILMANGADVDIYMLINSIDSQSVFDNLDTLMKHDAHIDFNKFVKKQLDDGRIDSSFISKNLEKLVKVGIDKKIILAHIDYKANLKEATRLLVAGFSKITININEVIELSCPLDVLDNFDALTEHGIKLDIDKVVYEIIDWMLPASWIVERIDALIEYGAKTNLDRLVHRLDDHSFEKIIPKLIKYGVDEKVILSRIKLMRKPKSKSKPKDD